MDQLVAWAWLPVSTLLLGFLLGSLKSLLRAKSLPTDVYFADGQHIARLSLLRWLQWTAAAQKLASFCGHEAHGLAVVVMALPLFMHAAALLTACIRPALYQAHALQIHTCLLLCGAAILVLSDTAEQSRPQALQDLALGGLAHIVHQVWFKC